MAETGIVTGQYVRIAQPVASVGDRLCAQLIDWLVQAGYLTAMIWLFFEAEHFYLGYSEWLAFVVIVIVLPVVFYGLLCEIFNKGQTIGKRLLKMRVVMADGTVPSLSAYLLRWMLMLVDGPALSYLGVVVMVVTRNKQRLGDLAAGTVVVKLRSYSKLQVSLDEFDYLSQGYTPHYAAAADLSLEQVNVVSRTLAGGDSLRTAQLAAKVQQLLQVSPAESSPAAFLRRILRDYQYYALEEI